LREGAWTVLERRDRASVVEPGVGELGLAEFHPALAEHREDVGVIEALARDVADSERRLGRLERGVAEERHRSDVLLAPQREVALARLAAVECPDRDHCYVIDEHPGDRKCDDDLELLADRGDDPLTEARHDERPGDAWRRTEGAARDDDADVLPCGDAA